MVIASATEVLRPDSRLTTYLVKQASPASSFSNVMPVRHLTPGPLCKAMKTLQRRR